MRGSQPFGSSPWGAYASAAENFTTGFVVTQFGTPNAAFTQYPLPTGFQATSFGTPRVVPGYVPGTLFAQSFGTPSGTDRYVAASLGPLTQFSPVYYRFNQTRVAAGFTRLLWGIPQATTTITTPLGRVCTVPGFVATRFGSSATPSAVIASGFQVPTFGTPKGAMVQVPSGFAVPSLGTPASVRQQRVSGIAPVSFGTAVSQRGFPATGFAPVRFGKVRSVRTREYIVYGIDASRRFGQPRALHGLIRDTSGSSTTQFGTPAVQDIHRVTHLPPVALFGTPLLTRTTLC